MTPRFAGHDRIPNELVVDMLTILDGNYPHRNWLIHRGLFRHVLMNDAPMVVLAMMPHITNNSLRNDLYYFIAWSSRRAETERTLRSAPLRSAPVLGRARAIYGARDWEVVLSFCRFGMGQCVFDPT